MDMHACMSTNILEFLNACVIAYKHTLIHRLRTYESSDMTANTSANKRIGQALRNLLCGARPYVSIGWVWAWGSAICFYYAALGHMFLLAGCGRGARAYVSIGWLWAWGSAIWFYYVPL